MRNTLLTTTDGMKFDKCTDYKDPDRKFWCSTQPNPEVISQHSYRQLSSYFISNREWMQIDFERNRYENLL